MRICIAVVLILIIQVLVCSAGDFKGFKGDSNGERRERAKDLTKRIAEAERDAARGKKLSSTSQRLALFVKSTHHTTRAGQSAKCQLEILREKLQEWQTAERAAGRTGESWEFWQLMRAKREHELRPSKGFKHADSSSSSSEEEEYRVEDEEDDVCPFQNITCPEWTHLYRTFDGSCNNVEHPEWGSAGRAQKRSIDPDYSDGISAPRKARSGKDLPSARKISNECIPTKSSPSSVNTLMLMTIGQFLDHDITHTPGATFTDDSGESKPVYCGDDNCGVDGEAGQDCLPIHIPEDDPMYEAGIKCMGLVRSEAYLEDGCVPGPRQQANLITSFVDASQCYGSARSETESLRDTTDPTRGKMKMNPNPMNPKFKDILPYQSNEESQCSGTDDVVKCFHAGDVRQNEQVGLTSMHTLIVRLHNYVENGLHSVNPKWDGEKLFNQSRRLVGALWQNMVYGEYLPVILGHKYMKHFRLEVGHGDKYNKEMNPDIRNVFSTAVFRFGHTLIPANMAYTNSQMEKMEYKNLADIFFNPESMYHCPFKNHDGAWTSPIDSCILGMCGARAESSDGFMSDPVRNHLFANPPTAYGLDLAALNIQRGRDHGLKGYVHWRKYVGLEVPWNFDAMDDIPEELRNKFKANYDHVEDVDLFVAGIAEKHVEGGIVGPTFARLIGKQFQELKFGDRFYFEFDNKECHDCSFNKDQKEAIKSYSLASMLCDTLDHVDKIQPRVFYQPYTKVDRFGRYKHQNFYDHLRNKNERVSCDEIAHLNFEVFAEKSDGSDSDSDSDSDSESGEGYYRYRRRRW